MDIPHSVRERFISRQGSGRPRLAVKPEVVDQIAAMLCEKLDHADGWRFYCRVGYRLSEATINRLLEAALKANSPAHYFSKAAKREMDGKGFKSPHGGQA